MQHQIVRLLKTREHAAISQIYDIYGAALYGFVKRIIPCNELAEQVIQDTFLKAWHNGPFYDESKDALFTWLLKIARNTAIDAIRSTNYRNNQKTMAWTSIEEPHR